MALLAPTLDQTIAAVTLMAAIAERIDDILQSSTESLYQTYPDHIQQFRAVREKTRRDMQFILRGTTISIIPGGEEVLAHALQKLTEAMFDRHFGGQFMWDAYEGLARSVEAHIQHDAKHMLIDALHATRDYIALMADLAEKEEHILNESMQALYDKYPDQMKGYRNAREATIHDQRVLLRSCALALLPAGVAQHQDMIEIMRTVTQSAQFDQSIMFDGYEFLQQSCMRHLQIGPISQLTQMLDQSVRLFAA